MEAKPCIILASGSPRRKELMQMLGFSDMQIVPAAGEENPPAGACPVETVRALSAAKAREVLARCGGDNSVIIAADTIVALDGVIFGKPHDEEEAFLMLSALSGRAHEVFTGVTVVSGGIELTEHERTLVRFRELSPDEIHRYIATGEPMDKAGAYGAQGLGALLVEGIEGDFFNVMGLPLCRLGRMLKRQGVSII